VLAGRCFQNGRGDLVDLLIGIVDFDVETRVLRYQRGLSAVISI
jgi:hypothetical protein